ncbi:MAG TPA: hypothetical protein VF262_03765 [Burkholderiales bacterium]
MGSLPLAAALVLAAAAGLAQAADCKVVHDTGSPLRRAVNKVKYLAETEAWERAAMKTATVQYVLLVNEPIRRNKDCYWPVEARAGGELWHRFYVTARGERVLVETAGRKLVTLEDWRATQRR